MTVYVDLLFGLNTLINYLLLRGSAVIGGCPVLRGRMIVAAAAGGIYAVAAVVWTPLQAWFWQGICVALMLVAAFGWKRSTVKQGLFFLSLSFALSGAVLLVVQWVEPDCRIMNGRAYYALSVPALLLVAGISYGLAAMVLAGSGVHTGGDVIAMTLHLRGQRIDLRALRDTGNVLRDPVTGQAVLVTDGRTLQKLLPEVDLNLYRDPVAALPKLAKQYPDLRFRLVPYQAVGVEHGLLLAVRCPYSWKKGRGTTLVAGSPTAVSPDKRFDAIWGGEML